MSLEIASTLTTFPLTVSCLAGVEEEIAVCVDRWRGQPVEGWRCSPSKPPVASGFRPCWGAKTRCPPLPDDAASTVIGRWLISMLRGVTDGD